MNRRTCMLIVILLGTLISILIFVSCGKEETKEIRLDEHFFQIVKQTPEEYMKDWKKDAKTMSGSNDYGYLSYHMEDGTAIVQLTEKQLSNSLSVQRSLLKDYQEEFSKDSEYWIEYDKDYGIISYFIDLDVDLNDLQWSWTQTWTRGAMYRIYLGYEDNYKPIIRIMNCHTKKLVTESDSDGNISWEKEDWEGSEH